jgi:hypothetical protein
MPRWILVIFAVTVMLSGVATAGPPVAPNEVCIYEHINYVGESACFRLEPGMRHKLVPTVGRMNDRASSIHVGEGVAEVFIYEHARFGGRSWELDTSVPILGRFNDIVSSMTIYPTGNLLQKWWQERRTDATPLFFRKGRGVELVKSGRIGSSGEVVFYPLAERLNDLEAVYPNLHWMDMNDKAIIVRLLGDVEVTLYEHANFGGKPLPLPGAGSTQKDFNLRDFHFDGIVSSLKVRQGTQ